METWFLEVKWEELDVAKEGNHCPKCGRFMRIKETPDDQDDCLVVGHCSNEGIDVIIQESRSVDALSALWGRE